MQNFCCTSFWWI